MALEFKNAKKEEDVKEVFNYNIDAFSDSPGFNWTFEAIKEEIKNGWKLYGVRLNGEIIAACFTKVVEHRLYSKNTAIKMTCQGSGYSQQIKLFFEKKARELNLKEIVHYCGIDDFRMYTLNENNGYKKSDKRLGRDGLVVEWIKKLR